MSGAAAYLILAAEIALGLILITAHEIRHHGLIPVLAASARHRPAPAPTPHAAWEQARHSRPLSRAAWMAAAGIDTALGCCWVTGHRTAVLISVGAAVLVIAAGQPLAVRASRRGRA